MLLRMKLLEIKTTLKHLQRKHVALEKDKSQIEFTPYNQPDGSVKHGIY